MNRAASISSTKKDTFKSPLLALPSGVLFILMILFPLILLALYSLAQGNISEGFPTAFSIQNYTKLFGGNVFLSLMVKSLLIGLEVTAICLVAGFPAAWALAKAVSPRHRNFLVVLTIIPFFISQLLLIYAIMVMFQPKGIVMSLLGFLKAADASGTIVYSRACVVFILVYEFLPYMILSIYSSLEQLDDCEVYASHTLGAGKLRTFFSVVLPKAAGGIRTGIILTFIPVVGSFVEPNVAGGPNGMMVGSFIDSEFSTAFDMCYGAAASLVFLLILLVAVLIIDLLFRAISTRREGVAG